MSIPKKRVSSDFSQEVLSQESGTRATPSHPPYGIIGEYCSIENLEPVITVAEDKSPFQVPDLAFVRRIASGTIIKILGLCDLAGHRFVAQLQLLEDIQGKSNRLNYSIAV